MAPLGWRGRALPVHTCGAHLRAWHPLSPCQREPSGAPVLLASDGTGPLIPLVVTAGLSTFTAQPGVCQEAVSDPPVQQLPAESPASVLLLCPHASPLQPGSSSTTICSITLSPSHSQNPNFLQQHQALQDTLHHH